MLSQCYLGFTYLGFMNRFLTTIFLSLLLTSVGIANDHVVHVDYHENGNIKVEVIKVHKGLHQVNHYYADGSLFETGFSKDGKTQGKWIRYDEQGDVIAVAYFHNNVKIGSWDHYDHNTQQSFKVSYVDGRAVRFRQYDPNGNLIASQERP